MCIRDRNTGLVDFIRITHEDPGGQADGDVLEGIQTTDPGQNQLLRYMKGTKVKVGRELTSRLFADYSFRVDEYDNQFDLRHQVELSYRLRRNLFIRAISELDSQRVLGRPPDRRALLENRWRFGRVKRKEEAMGEATASGEEENEN